jgi:hypothetical protein
MTTDEFLQDIEQFLDLHEMSASRFGVLALNDRDFVFRMRRGSDVRINTINRVREFMSRQGKSQKSKGAEAAA